MTAGSVIVLAFWVIFTVRKHFTPKSGMGRKRPCGAYDRVAGVLAGRDIDRDILCFRLPRVRGCRR